MKFSKLFCVLLMCIVGYANATVTPITLTGFNADVVANGIGAASASTTHDVDSGGYAFLSPDYQLTSTSTLPTKYLPGSGLINSVNTSGLSFQLAAYTGLNCLRLQTTSSGTLTFGTPTAATILYVLGFSGSGSSTATITVKFSDNSTQVFSNITFGDWYGGSGYAIGDVGRVVRSTGVTDFAQTTGPRLYEMPLALNASNFSKQIVSVTVARTGGSAGNSILNIMGITTSDATFAGGNYTINSGMPTAGTNFQSFTDAVSALKSGAITGAVTFDVAQGSGPYVEKIVIPTIPGASGVSRVTFNCNGVTMSSNISDAANRACIVLNGADYITFDSLNIDVSAGTYGWGIALMGQADSNIIRKCTITVSASNTTSGNHMGIVINGTVSTTASAGNNANGNQFLNNTIIGGYYGVYCYGSSTAYNKRNTFSGNTIKEFYSYGFYSIYQDSLTISKTELTRPTRATVTTTYGIYNSSCTNLLVEKNKIHNLFDAATASTSTFYGFYVASTGVSAALPNKYINNEIYNINNGTGSDYGFYALSYNYVNYYHNTVIFDNSASASGAVYGMYVYGTGVNVKNNIVYVTRAGSGTKYCLYFSSTGVASSNNNILYLNAPAGTNYYGYYISAYSSFTSWQAIFDALSKNIDPGFVNISAGDLTPSNSNINDMGATGLGVSTDINDVTRGSNPDPGAVEFSLAGCSNPPVAGGAISSVTDVCLNTTFTLDLSGNSIGAGQTYLWQRRKNSTATWASIGTAATSPTLSLTQDTSYTYRCAVQCSGGTIVYSSEIQVNSPLLVSGTFSINSGQPTSGSNFQTFTEAINYIGCGINGPVVFNVALGSGPYNEKVSIPQVLGTSVTNTITINGNGTTLSYNTTDANNRTALLLNGTDHVIIDSLNIDVNAGTYGWGIALIGQADSNIIRKCTITSSISSTSTNYIGIVINGQATSTAISGNNGNGNLIEKNTINGGYYGIYLYGSTSTYNKRNIIKENVIKDYYLYGIYAYGNDSVTFSKNDIYRPNRTLANLTTNYGIYVSSSTHGLIEKNKVHSPFDGNITSNSTSYGIYIATSGISATEPNRIENNLIYKINNGAGSVYGFYSLSYNYNNYYHNTVVLDDASATAGTTYGMYAYGTGVDIRNNNIVIARGGTGGKYCIYTGTGTFATSNNNNLINTSSAGTNGVVYYSSIGYSTLSAWQASNSSAFDQQSLSVDPVFASPAIDDYKPTTSLLDNKGISVNTLTDILDSTRSATVPDIGSYEFSTLLAGLNFGAESIVSPVVNLKGCYTNNEAVVVKIRNRSTATHNFATNPVTVTLNITGTITQTLTTTVNTGTLASDSTLNVTLSTGLNMTTAGSYVFNASTSLSGDVNSTDDAMPETTRTKVDLSPGTIAISPTSYCVNGGVNPSLSTTGSGGYSSVQWQVSNTTSSGFTNISGATTTSYSYSGAITQDKYFRLIATCGTVDNISSEVSLVYNNPVLTSTTPGSRCGAGTVNLSATAASGNTVNWYSSPTGGTSLATGNTFTTPTLSSSTTYYASAGNGTNGLSIPGDGGWNHFTATGSFQTTTITGAYMILTVSAPITLTSMDIYPSSAIGTAFTIEARTVSASGVAFTSYSGTTTVQNTTTPTVAQTLNINWVLPVGTYYIGFSNTNPGCWRSGAVTHSLPWSLSGVASLDYYLTPSYQYYFYNLQLSTGCEGSRTAVLATIDTSAGCGATVPVTITKFKGERLTEKNNSLTWTTSTEINNKGFELERSADGISFSSIVFVPSLSNNGNSNTQIDYSFNDAKPFIGNNYYRLKQIDKDGKYAYSQIILIKGNKVKDIVVSSLYPNPTTDVLKLQIESPVKEHVSLLITDLTGKTVINRVYQLQNGTNSYSLPISNLANGTYLLKLICSSGCEKQVLKFVKQ